MAEIDTPPLTFPERLNDQHDLTSFEAGQEDTGSQTEWLKRSALRNDQDGYTRTFVACFSGTNQVGGFYGLATATVARGNLPRSLRPNGTPAVIPAVLLARLAIDESLQGRGLGKAIVIEAIAKCMEVLEGVAFRFIIVDAATPKARALYTKFDFRALDPIEFPDRLYLPIVTAAKLIA